MKKQIFYSNLNMEDITATDYIHAKRLIRKILKLKGEFLCEYHYLLGQRDTLLLAEVF